MLRVVGGLFRGRKLDQPPLTITRPTKDIAKEGLFNSLGNIEGLSFLDCFAGSGAMGIEAKSRGASFVAFIEKDKSAIKVLRKNIETVGLSDYKVLEGDFFKNIERLNCNFDLIFVDPPYKMVIDSDFLLKLEQNNLIGENTRIIIERDSTLNMNEFEGYSFKELKYGKSYLYILRK